MSGPCVKTRVIATLITRDGQRFVGENDCENPQDVCPRADYAFGEGYHFCWEVCEQKAHAEINAIHKAGKFACESTIYLEGHTRCCDNCQGECDELDINVIIGSPPNDH